MSSFFHRKKGSSPHRSASPKSARKGSTSPSNSRHTPQRGGGGGGEGGGTTSSGDVLTNIVAARQGSGSSNPDGTDVWGYLYAEKNRKGNKKKDSSLIVEYDQEDDMIVRLEGFMMKKGEGLVASFKKRWFVFDIRTDSEVLIFLCFYSYLLFCYSPSLGEQKKAKSQKNLSHPLFPSFLFLTETLLLR